MYYALAAIVVALIIMLGGGAIGIPYAAKIGKMAASTGFIAMAISTGGLTTPYGRIVLIGLFFSWWGDFFLMYGGLFLYGLIAFFIAHLAYSAAFIAHGIHLNTLLIALALLAIPAIGVGWWLNPNLGDMRYPVYAYITVITLMVALAFGAWGRGASHWLVIAAVLFYLSDLFVARQRFMTPSPLNPLIGLPLYYAAQIVFAYTIKLVR